MNQTGSTGFSGLRGLKSFAITFLFLVAGCDPECSDKIISKVSSPDGKFEATAFIRDCGATTDFSPQVYLCPKGEKMAKVGNIFVGNHSDQIRIEWISATQLKIHSECDVMRMATNYEGVTIQFAKDK